MVLPHGRAVRTTNFWTGTPASCARVSKCAAASALVALTTQRRAELLHAAGAAGARVYHEPTRRFLDRLAAYWDAWTVSR